MAANQLDSSGKKKPPKKSGSNGSSLSSVSHCEEPTLTHKQVLAELEKACFEDKLYAAGAGTGSMVATILANGYCIFHGIKFSLSKLLHTAAKFFVMTGSGCFAVALSAGAAPLIAFLFDIIKIFIRWIGRKYSPIWKINNKLAAKHLAHAFTSSILGSVVGFTIGFAVCALIASFGWMLVGLVCAGGLGLAAKYLIQHKLRFGHFANHSPKEYKYDKWAKDQNTTVEIHESLLSLYDCINEWNLQGPIANCNLTNDIIKKAYKLKIDALILQYNVNNKKELYLKANQNSRLALEILRLHKDRQTLQLYVKKLQKYSKENVENYRLNIEKFKHLQNDNNNNEEESGNFFVRKWNKLFNRQVSQAPKQESSNVTIIKSNVDNRESDNLMVEDDNHRYPSNLAIYGSAGSRSDAYAHVSSIDNNDNNNNRQDDAMNNNNNESNVLVYDENLSLENNYQRKESEMSLAANDENKEDREKCIQVTKEMFEEFSKWDDMFDDEIPILNNNNNNNINVIVGRMHHFDFSLSNSQSTLGTASTASTNKFNQRQERPRIRGTHNQRNNTNNNNDKYNNDNIKRD